MKQAHAAGAGPYPERRDRLPSALAGWRAQLVVSFARWTARRHLRSGRFLSLIAGLDREVRLLGDDGLRAAALGLRAPLRTQGYREDLVCRSFALVREAARRTMGLSHHDVQLVGGRVVLAGMIAEMETGEGKTLTATLAACTAALAGRPVHVVTVNDYLAGRDAAAMEPVYRSLGLSVGAVDGSMERSARRTAYACDVTYCTNKELAFDYLRDRLAIGRRSGRIDFHLARLAGEGSAARDCVLRGLHYAIVDEADSVLVDEARTPLVIASRGEHTAERGTYADALTLAGQLTADRDFVLDAGERHLALTEAGAARLAELAHDRRGLWASRLHREDVVRQALTALHLFERDRHYLVRDDGQIAVIDEFTGRLMRDRSWEHGLHQLIEVKEGCSTTAPGEVRARISFQRFFRRYLCLGGMTGTAREVATELRRVYGLGVVRIPTHHRLRRRAGPDRVYATADARWEAVVRRVASLHRERRPVLIGTRSVVASEHLSALLHASGLPHRVLNARQDREEAAIIAGAGHAGQITVATNMAGRGTDIRLGPGVAEAGGLHVIATERHEARRIDRQLFGRCARQGDPGSHEAMLSLGDELLVRYAGVWRWLGQVLARRGGLVPASLARLAVRRAQRTAERADARMRANVLRVDDNLDQALGFCGSRE